MKPTRAIAAALIAGSMIAAPAAAANTARSVVTEAVVTKMSPAGSIRSTVVEQLIRLEGSDASPASVSVPNAANLQSYRNLSGFNGASGEGGNLVWRTSGNRDVLALAKTSKRLPVDVTVRYFLDGNAISAKALQGRSGVVRIEVQIDNTSGTAKDLTYKGVSSPYLTSVTTQYLPLQYMVRADFPNDRWTGLNGQDVTVLPGSDVQVASASGFISPPVTDTSRTVSFEARSGDVLTPKIQVFVTPQISQQVLDSLQKQYDALQTLYAGSGAISDNLKKVYDGTNALVDGVQKLLGGVGTNDPVTHKPVVNLDANGLPTTLLGAIGLIGDGVSDKILPGIGTRDAKTGLGVMTLDDNGKTTTLIGGLQSQKNTYDGKLIPAVKDALKGLDTFKSTVAGGGSQLGSGITQLMDGLDTQFGGGLDDLVAALGDKNAPISLVDTATGNPCGAPSATCVPADVMSALKLMGAGVVQLVTGVGDKAAAISLVNTTTGLPCGAPSATCVPANVMSALKLISGGASQLLTFLGDKAAPISLVDTTTGLPCGAPSATCQPATVMSALKLSGSTLATLGGGLSSVITGLQSGSTSLTALKGLADATAAGAGCVGDPNCAAYATISAGLAGVIGALGTTSTAGTALGTLQAISGGITQLGAGVTALIDKLQTNDPAHPGFSEGLQQMVGGITALIDKLQTNDLAHPGLREGLQQLGGGLTALMGSLQTDALGTATCGPADQSDCGFREGMLLLLGGLGNAGSPANTATVMGALKLLAGGQDKLVQGVLGGLDQLRTGFSNPEFTKPQAALGGRTPKQYFKDCPGCFDPTFKKFDPATADPKFKPSLLEVFTLFSEGIKGALPQLASLDNAHPGLVEGLKQVVTGLDQMASKLQTFDPKNPGLVDGMQLVRGGLQQAGQGIFAINELGLNTLHGQVGDQGDGVSQASTALADAAHAAATSSVLGSSADSVSTTYVYVIDAQSTAKRDNTVRWALTGAVLALMGGFAWRPRLIRR